MSFKDDTIGVTLIQVVYLDDNPFELEDLSNQMSQMNSAAIKLDTVDNSFEFLRKIRLSQPHAVVLDINLGDGDREGIELIPIVRRICPTTLIVMLSGHNDSEAIQSCLKAGADDFLYKDGTSSPAHQLIKIFRSRLTEFNDPSTGCNRARRLIELENEVVGLTMKRVLRQLAKVAHSPVSSVHVYGESGTGKEIVADLLAQLVHPKPFLRVNCGAINSSLIESELFGYKRGAFTGASFDKTGYIEAASGGWLFLDEVSSLTPHAQVALLRAIENQTILPLGEAKPKKVNVRFMSATNEDLADLVQKGKFRRDLWQRLKEMEFHLPPLRERREEIPDLVRHFCETFEGGPFEVTLPTMQLLCERKWDHGNVRELRNCLRVMAAFSDNKVLTPGTIPSDFFRKPRPVEANTASHLNTEGLDRSRASFETLVDQLGNPQFGELVDVVFFEYLRLIHRRHGRLSLRKLEPILGLSKSSISRRVQSLLEKNVSNRDELSKIVEVRGPR